ncbi:MAG: hypothetical protein SVU32_02020, partial [Candidatus Nanohaloarchaea archaeon]|nr:hypothetical protein [Candidatus Nanohaloarchaea archaeon]
MEDIELDVRDHNHEWWRVEKNENGWRVVGKWEEGELDTDVDHSPGRLVEWSVWEDEDGNRYNWGRNRDGEVVLERGPGMEEGGGAAGGAAGAAEGAAEEAEEAAEEAVSLPFKILGALNPFGGGGHGGGSRGGRGGGGRMNVNVNMDRGKHWGKRILYGLVFLFLLSAVLISPVSDPLWDQLDRYDIDGPGEATIRAVTYTTSTIGQGVSAAQTGVTWYIASIQCNMKAAQTGQPGNERFITNCKRRALGKPPINQSTGPKATFNVQNSLSVELRSEVKTDAAYLEPVCGSQCGIAEVALTNEGEKRIKVTRLSLFVESEGDAGGLAPFIVNSSKLSDPLGKTYLLHHFVRGTDELGDWTSASQSPIRLEPGQQQVVTFLVNLSQYSTFTRSCWVNDVREGISSREAGEFNASACSNGTYQGGKLYAKGVDPDSNSLNYEQISASEAPDDTSMRWLLRQKNTFPDYSCDPSNKTGCICKTAAQEVARECTEPRFKQYSYEYGVAVNYVSNTSSTMNLAVTNQNYWANLHKAYEGISSTSEAQKQFKEERCTEINENTDIVKQVSSPYPLTSAVSLLMYSDCEIHYNPDNSRPARLSVKVFGDESSVSLFSIKQMYDNQGSRLEPREVCGEVSTIDTGAGKIAYPWQMDESLTWYLPQQKKDANPETEHVMQPRETICSVDIPAIVNMDTLTLSMGAKYEALTMVSGEF